MSLTWIREAPPRWDADKAAIVGGAPAGIFELAYRAGDLLPGEWWRVEGPNGVAGYGWLDTTWGEAEILLAVAPASRRQGVGAFILDKLEAEVAAAGLNYMYNVVRDTHPDKQGVSRWLEARGFKPHSDGRLVRELHR